MNKRYYIKNVGISITDLNSCVGVIGEYIDCSEETGYVCVTNVRATYIGNNDEEYCSILNNSLLTVPDGKPLEWFARLIGIKKVNKTSGNDLFEAICKISEKKGYRHYFLGSSPEVINLMTKKVKEKYPKLEIVGSLSPPYGSEKELINDRLINDINLADPHILWIGLGAPKQERFINLIKDKVNVSILIGVGLVFEYQAGTVNRAPLWICNIGLEWMYIWFQQPRKILRSIPYFIDFLFLLFLKLVNNDNNESKEK